MNLKPVIYLTQGSERGVGSEIVYKALKRINRKKAEFIFVSDEAYLKRADEEFKGFYKLFDDVILFKKKKESSFESFEKSVELVLMDERATLVTLPVSKKEWIDGGYDFKGHTDYFDKKFNKKTIMFFWADKLKVSLYTHHIPLRDIFKEIKKEKIINYFKELYSELSIRFGFEYKYVFSSINPHSGEGGSIGNEEEEIVKPAIYELKKEGYPVYGPYPNDTVFYKFNGDKNTVIISFSHDLGLSAFKMLYFKTGVNLTLSLPFIRTSPDHGIGEDIKGKGVADETALFNAIELSISLKERENERKDS